MGPGEVTSAAIVGLGGVGGLEVKQWDLLGGSGGGDEPRGHLGGAMGAGSAHGGVVCGAIVVPGVAGDEPVGRLREPLGG